MLGGCLTVPPKRPKRIERAPQQMYVVCEQQDCRRPKYLVNDSPAGFERELADHLAARAHPGQPEYTVVPVEVFTWARAAGEPMSAQRAVELFADMPIDDEAA